MLVCCTIDSSLPLSMEVIQPYAPEGFISSIANEVEEIVESGKSTLNKLTAYISDIPFLELQSSESVLLEAKRLGILSESTYETIIALEKYESESFRSKPQTKFDSNLEVEVKSVNTALYTGKVGYFMSRFLLKWSISKKVSCNLSSTNGAEQKNCCCCVVDHDNVVEVRRMVDTDWLYLGELTKCQNLQRFSLEAACTREETENKRWKINSCAEFSKLSALRALQSLKSIPAGARRGLPVLIDSQGLLLSIPVILLSFTPHYSEKSFFSREFPLGRLFVTCIFLFCVKIPLLFHLSYNGNSKELTCLMLFCNVSVCWIQALSPVGCICSIQAKGAPWWRP